MEKNEIVINGVHHVLVEGKDKPSLSHDCENCSVLSGCDLSICEHLFNAENSHFEIKDKAMSKEEFNIVVQVMGLLRCGKISTLTPNCEVREILLAEKIEHKNT